MGGSESRSGSTPLPELTGGALPTAPDRPNVEKDRARAKAMKGLFGGSAAPLRVGRYEIRKKLGAGAMGVVYEALDSQLDRVVALKVLNPTFSSEASASLNERMLREARAMAQLSHPNVATVFDVGTHDGQVFLAMEFIGGGTLRAWLGAGPHPWREVLRVLLAAGSGLAAAHGRGLIHRDFKPDNVLLDVSGQPKIVDFGLVRSVDVDGDQEPGPTRAPEARLTRTGALLGTPVYMPPEQLRGEPVDARCDQFAFCATLFESLNGRRPFQGGDIDELMEAVEQGVVTARSEQVPAPIQQALLKGLSADPAGRFTSMDALLAELARGLEASSPHRRRFVPVIAAVAALLIVFVVAIAALATWSLSRRRGDGGRVVSATGSLDFSALDQRDAALGDGGATASAAGGSSSKVMISAADQALLRRVRSLEAAGQYRECLDLGESAPSNVLLFGYRTTCAMYLQDWDAYDRACRDWERLEPAFYNEELCSPTAIALHKHTSRHEWTECLTVAESGPPSLQNLAYRISCSSMIGDWEANRRACSELAKVSPQHAALATCRAFQRMPGATKR